jgi:hypothetical protein
MQEDRAGSESALTAVGIGLLLICVVWLSGCEARSSSLKYFKSLKLQRDRKSNRVGLGFGKEGFRSLLRKNFGNLGFRLLGMGNLNLFLKPKANT